MAVTDKITINLEDLGSVPFRDQIAYEDFTGTAFSAIGNAGETPPARVMVGLVWLARRKHDPSFTLEQAMDYDYTTVDIDGGDENPTEAAEPTPLQPLRDDKPSRKARASA